MRKMLLVAALAIAGGAAADKDTELNPHPHHFPTKEQFAARAKRHGGSNLVYHGGPVIHSARVVPVFWGPSWGAGGSDAAIASHIQSFFGQFGTSAEYNTITQYSDGTGPIQTTTLGNTWTWTLHVSNVGNAPATFTSGQTLVADNLMQPFLLQSLRIHLGQDIFTRVGETWQPFATGGALLLVFWLILYWMYRRKIFLRI